MRSIGLWMWCRRFFEKVQRVSRASRVLASQQVSRAFRALADLFAGRLRISSVKDCYVADGFLDALERFGGYFDADCSHVVCNLLRARRADDCGSDFGPAKNPGKRHLRHGQAEVGRYGLELLDCRKKKVGAEMASSRFHEHVHLLAGGAASRRGGLSWRLFSAEYSVREGGECEVADSMARACREYGSLGFAP